MSRTRDVLRLHASEPCLNHPSVGSESSDEWTALPLTRGTGRQNTCYLLDHVERTRAWSEAAFEVHVRVTESEGKVLEVAPWRNRAMLHDKRPTQPLLNHMIVSLLSVMCLAFRVRQT